MSAVRGSARSSGRASGQEPASILVAGAAYGLALFAAGFVLGAIRVTFVAPNTGALAAVALELPAMLLLAWWLAGRAVARAPRRPAAGWLAAGVTGFAVLMACEALLAAAAFGIGPAAFLAGLATGPGALGLAGQAAAGVVPLLRALRRPRAERSDG